MWNDLAQRLEVAERRAFLHAVILATDEIIADEPLPVYQVPATPKPALRTRRQRLARRLAEQVQLLAACTPPRCTAARVIERRASVTVEQLIIAFGIGQVPQDYNQRWRLSRLNIEFTTSSKRGWVQHRRASDRVRAKVIDLARALLMENTKACPEDQINAVLVEFSDLLASLPDMDEEHRDDPALRSQKASYLDWFRLAYRESLHYSIEAGQSPLSLAGWATLAGLMANDPTINTDDIAHAVRACQIL